METEYKAFLSTLAVLAILASIILWCFGCGDNHRHKKNDPIYDYSVTYKVWSHYQCSCDKPLVDITYIDANNDYRNIYDIEPPWEYTFEGKTGMYTLCSITYEGSEDANVKAAIYVDGRIADEMISVGNELIEAFAERTL